MNHLKEISSGIDSPEFKALFKTKPHLHALAIVYNWIIIIATILLALQFPNLFTFFIAIVIIGARMHALAILTHDAAHYRFLKNRTWNDLITNMVSMYPMFLSVQKYRKNHLKHHRHLNTEDDPDWVAKLGARAFQFPKTKKEFLLTVASYLTLYPGLMDALWFLKRFGVAEKKEQDNDETKKIQLGFYMVLFTMLTILGGWKIYLLFWVVPYFSTFFMFQYIRSVAEHFGDMAYENELNSSRNVKPTWIERFLIAPHHVGYHLDHHLYPAVPFYHLPKLHQMLMQQEIYKKHAHITEGYISGLLSELGKTVEGTYGQEYEKLFSK